MITVAHEGVTSNGNVYSRDNIRAMCDIALHSFLLHKESGRLEDLAGYIASAKVVESPNTLAMLRVAVFLFRHGTKSCHGLYVTPSIVCKRGGVVGDRILDIQSIHFVLAPTSAFRLAEKL